MRHITAHELKQMTFSQLEVALHEQEQSLRDLAIADGFGPHSTPHDLAVWAKDKPQTRNIDLLDDAINARGGDLPRTVLRKLLYLALALVLIALFMWIRS